MADRKRGAPIGNRNAVGNHGGAPLNNTNALKHGGYAAISWDDLSEQEWELVAAMPIDCEQLLMDEISLLSVRERRIMHRIAKLRGVESGMVKAVTMRTEEKREFSGEEERLDYQACVDAAVQAGDRLPGHPYRITVTQEAVHNIILRMEDDLTHCQEIKRKSVELLAQMHTDLAPSSTDIDDMIIAALRGPQRGNGRIISQAAHQQNSPSVAVLTALKRTKRHRASVTRCQLFGYVIRLSLFLSCTASYPFVPDFLHRCTLFQAFGTIAEVGYKLLLLPFIGSQVHCLDFAVGFQIGHLRFLLDFLVLLCYNQGGRGQSRLTFLGGVAAFLAGRQLLWFSAPCSAQRARGFSFWPATVKKWGLSGVFSEFVFSGVSPYTFGRLPIL